MHTNKHQRQINCGSVWVAMASVSKITWVEHLQVLKVNQYTRERFLPFLFFARKNNQDKTQTTLLYPYSSQRTVLSSLIESNFFRVKSIRSGTTSPSSLSSGSPVYENTLSNNMLLRLTCWLDKYIFVKPRNLG